MSLKELVQKSVGVAFASLGDLVSTVTYVEPDGAYNTTTGESAAGARHSAAAVVSDYGLREIAGTSIQLSDKQFIFNATGLGFIPATGGSIIHEGITYQVESVQGDPADASYTVQGRR